MSRAFFLLFFFFCNDNDCVFNANRHELRDEEHQRQISKAHRHKYNLANHKARTVLDEEFHDAYSLDNELNGKVGKANRKDALRCREGEVLHGGFIEKLLLTHFAQAENEVTDSGNSR